MISRNITGDLNDLNKVLTHSVTVWKNEKFTHPKMFSSNQLLNNFVSKSVTFTKFLPKMCETKLQQFPQCECEITEIRSLTHLTKSS